MSVSSTPERESRRHGSFCAGGVNSPPPSTSSFTQSLSPSFSLLFDSSLALHFLSCHPYCLAHMLNHIWSIQTERSSSLQQPEVLTTMCV
mmetsp:Transcript_140241/g.244261  ORF Transcript_140241/g.244261 Transcript_140241/m.244261 type:complete len:90 (+) Transcript_140241:319-588(+)